QTPGAAVAGEARMRHKDGSWHWVQGMATNQLAEPLVRGVVVNCRDITGRKKLEDELRQAKKMEAIGRLAGGVAHDFNNLLTVICGHCQLAVEEVALDDPLRTSLGEIHSAAERAAELTRQLLAFSRKQMLQPSVLNLNQVVANVQPLLGRLIGEHI